MGIVCVDWRAADTGAIAPLYSEERSRWSMALGWETAASWDQIEAGRRLGTVPGLLALDSNGAIAGWTFYLVHRGVLQIGGFVAGSEPATTALLDGIFSSEQAARAQSVTVFVFTDAPGLSSALTRRSLTVGAYDYLMKPLPITPSPDHSITPSPHHPITPSPHHPITPSPHYPITRSLHHPITPLPHHPITPSPRYPIELRRWRVHDGEAVAALLRAAYPGADGVRPFAPLGTVDEWQEYVGQLVGAAGCGTIMPDSCFVVPGDREQVSGVVLVTRLAPGTAHIAQLAVDPHVQRRGLGHLLVSAACASASDAGCEWMTLLVEGRNLGARRLYDASGFNAASRFVSAGIPQPVRLTSVAFGGRVAIRA